jgi:hypothetical protein
MARRVLTISRDNRVLPNSGSHGIGDSPVSGQDWPRARCHLSLDTPRALRRNRDCREDRQFLHQVLVVTRSIEVPEVVSRTVSRPISFDAVRTGFMYLPAREREDEGDGGHGDTFVCTVRAVRIARLCAVTHSKIPMAKLRLP